MTQLEAKTYKRYVGEKFYEFDIPKGSWFISCNKDENSFYFIFICDKEMKEIEKKKVLVLEVPYNESVDIDFDLDIMLFFDRLKDDKSTYLIFEVDPERE